MGICQNQHCLKADQISRFQMIIYLRLIPQRTLTQQVRHGLRQQPQRNGRRDSGLVLGFMTARCLSEAGVLVRGF